MSFLKNIRKKKEIEKISSILGGIEKDKGKIDHVLKIIVIGDDTEGKRLFLKTFFSRMFHEDGKKSVGIDFYEKVIETQLDVGPRIIKLTLWDISADSKFQELRQSLYQGAVGCLLIFDENDRISFENVPEWMNEVNTVFKKKIPTIIVGVESTLEEPIIKYDEIKEEFGKYNVYFMQVSTIKKEGGIECLHNLSELILNIEPTMKKFFAIKKEKLDHPFRVIILGDQNETKRRFLDILDSEELEGLKDTIGANFYVKSINMDTYEGEIPLRVQIWDLSIEDRFKQLRQEYYKKVDGYFILFDFSIRESFDVSITMIEELIASVGNKKPIILLGINSDPRLLSVSYDEIDMLVELHGIVYREIFTFKESDVFSSTILNLRKKMEDACTTCLINITQLILGIEIPNKQFL